jgi:CheY-like chemotaxis protein
VTKRVVWSDRVRGRVESGPSSFTQRASLETRAAGAFEALLAMVANEPTDLVVLDAFTGTAPAEDACRRLRADPRTAGIPILVLAADGADPESLQRAGCNEVIPEALEPRLIQEKIAGALGLRLRRHPRFPVVLPVARGRIFHEFLGYSNSLSESGMGFDTIARIRGGDELSLKIYRSTEEKPIAVSGRVCGVRPNIDTGVGYTVGIEFVRLATDDRRRLVELFPSDGCVTWGSDAPEGEPVSQEQQA